VNVASKRTLRVDQCHFNIRAIENGGKKVTSADVLDLAHPLSIVTSWKNKEKILRTETEGSSCKKIKKPKFEDLDHTGHVVVVP